MKCDYIGKLRIFFLCIAALNSLGKNRLIYGLLGFLLKVNNDLGYRDFNAELSSFTNGNSTSMTNCKALQLS